MRPILAVGVAAVMIAIVPAARGEEGCDRIVSYVCTWYAADGKGQARSEWRVYDPVLRRDRTFLSLPGVLGGMRWSPDYSHAEYCLGDQVYGVDWKLGATPRAIVRLPRSDPWIRDWWFNPDSARWQVFDIEERWQDQYSGLLWHTRLWQASRDGRRWHIVAADSGICTDEGCDDFEPPWPAVSRSPFVTLDSLEHDMFPDADRATEEMEPPPGESDNGEWVFLPSRSAPQRGVACLMWIDIQVSARLPLYFVDRTRHTSRIVYGRKGQSDVGVGLQEECGYMLVTDGDVGLIDLTTGETVLPNEPARKGSSEPKRWQPSLSGGVWVPPPRP